jgi:hypothetical protein
VAEKLVVHDHRPEFVGVALGLNVIILSLKSWAVYFMPALQSFAFMCDDFFPFLYPVGAAHEERNYDTDSVNPIADASFSIHTSLF